MKMVRRYRGMSSENLDTGGNRMKTVGMGPDLWAAVYLSLLEYGVCLIRQGAPTKHIHTLLDVLMPPIAAAAGRPRLLSDLEDDLRGVVAARERAIAAPTN